MRRFIYEDNEHDVKLTLDMSEEVFTLMKKSKKKDKFEALKSLILYTFEKGIGNDRSWNDNLVDPSTNK